MPGVPGLTWSPAAGQYRAANGRFLSRRQVTDTMRAATANAAARFDTLAGQLQAGTITLADWQTATRIALREVHSYSAMVEVGGAAQMTPALWGTVGAQLKTEYRYLAELAAQIEAGRPLDGRFRLAARRYALSGRLSGEAAATRTLVARGFDQEENIRGLRDSCPGCLDATAAGVVPIGTLPVPGDRIVW